jgi:hypothetical protein
MMARAREIAAKFRQSRSGLILGIILIVLTLASSRPVNADRAGAPAGSSWIYLPTLTNTTYVYLPFISKIVIQAINLANGSFEADTAIDFVNFPNAPCRYFGFTDTTRGNQHPSGWTYYSPDHGQVMPFPTKMQMGNVVPAISGGPGEYVHKCWWQLPDVERLGQPRGLILEGNWMYKAFNSGNPQALQLSQVLTGTPGYQMQVTGYFLGETPDQPTGPKLEDDHFIGSVQLGSVADTRFYAAMILHNDVPGNERHWNKYVVSATIPNSGQLLLTIIVQQNWAGETDFFLDNFQAVEWAPD